MRSILRTVIQVFIFILLSKGSGWLVSLLHIPIPGSVIGIALLFTLLKLRIVRLEWVETGATWLIAQMLLFFIPSAVGIINYKSLVISSGPAILLVIIISTAVVMISSGAIAQWLSSKRAAHHNSQHMAEQRVNGEARVAKQGGFVQ